MTLHRRDQTARQSNTHGIRSAPGTDDSSLLHNRTSLKIDCPESHIPELHISPDRKPGPDARRRITVTTLTSGPAPLYRVFPLSFGQALEPLGIRHWMMNKRRQCWVSAEGQTGLRWKICVRAWPSKTEPPSYHSRVCHNGSSRFSASSNTLGASPPPRLSKTLLRAMM